MRVKSRSLRLRGIFSFHWLNPPVMYTSFPPPLHVKTVGTSVGGGPPCILSELGEPGGDTAGELREWRRKRDEREKEEGRGKREEGRGKREEGRGKRGKREGREKREEGEREEGRGKDVVHTEDIDFIGPNDVTSWGRDRSEGTGLVVGYGDA